jgi:hypothetical protein
VITPVKIPIAIEIPPSKIDQVFKEEPKAIQEKV